MPLTFKILPESKWTKKGTCFVKCVYSLTLYGKRYPERQWTATYENGKKIEVPGAKWIAYKGVETKKRQAHNRVSLDHEFAPLINHRLDQIERAAKIIEHKVSADNRTCTPEIFKRYWDIQFSSAPVLDVFQIYLDQQEKRVRIKDLSKSTYNTAKNVFERLKYFESLRFRDFNKNFPERFVKENKGLKDGTLRSYLSVIKSFLRWAKEESYHKQDSYESWKLPKASKKDFALKLWQIRKLEDMQTDNEKIDWARDHFLFLFYTAMRLTEPRSIVEIEGESDFVRTFEYRVNKQRKETWVQFELPEPALVIWDKYKGDFDLYSRHSVGKYMRLAAKEAGLSPAVCKKFTPHVARHTFITIVRGMNFDKADIARHTMQGDRIIDIYDHSKKRSDILVKFAEKLKEG